MPVKFIKQTKGRRGARTFGYGKTGQHRNKGQIGGTGKTTGRLKHKRTQYIIQKNLGFPDPDWILGKRGFKLPPSEQRINNVNAINIKDIELELDCWVKDSKVEKKGETIIIDLSKLNYQKLLGKGEITKKLEITVEKASKKAVEKFKEAKCKLTVTAPADEE